jgi:hypothetical protein
MRDLQTFEPALPDSACAPEEIAIDQIAMDQIAMDQIAMDQMGMDQMGMDQIGIEPIGIEQGQGACAAAEKTDEPAGRSPWQSLGGVFDYEHWEDRDRFVELDFLILLSRSEDDEPYRPRRNAHLAAA